VQMLSQEEAWPELPIMEVGGIYAYRHEDRILSQL
jgi:hypothetical protein